MADKLKDYKQGFNSGYILSKYAPDLTDLIFKDIAAFKEAPLDEWQQGLMHGKQEYEIELKKGEPQKARRTSKERERDPDRDKD